METVIALILWWLLVAAIVIVGAPATALAIYLVIVFLLWLAGRAVNKARIKGRRCQ